VSEPERPPCDAVEGWSDTANLEGLERRVCPTCRLYFDVGPDSPRVYCGETCRLRGESW
jgi:hypothetical protein